MWQCPQFCAHRVAPLWLAAADFFAAVGAAAFPVVAEGLEQPASTMANPPKTSAALPANNLHAFKFIRLVLFL